MTRMVLLTARDGITQDNLLDMAASLNCMAMGGRHMPVTQDGVTCCRITRAWVEEDRLLAEGEATPLPR